jgi:X-X-X-Leu-X-X-Gly heptad repeat protein
MSVLPLSGQAPIHTGTSGHDLAVGGAPALRSDDEAVALPPLDIGQLMAAMRQSATRGAEAPGDEADVTPADFEPALADAQDNLSTDLYAFLALYAKLAQTARTAARDIRELQLQAQKSALESAADEMTLAAQERYTAAVSAAIGQIVSGAVSIGSGLFSLRTLARPETSFLATRLGLAPDLSSGSAFNSGLRGMQDMASGSGQIADGLAKLASASSEREAGLADARAKGDEAAATEAQARRDAAQDLIQAMTDTLRDIREKLAAIVQSNLETTRGIARNI